MTTAERGKEAPGRRSDETTPSPRTKGDGGSLSWHKVGLDSGKKPCGVYGMSGLSVEEVKAAPGERGNRQ